MRHVVLLFRLLTVFLAVSFLAACGEGTRSSVLHQPALAGRPRVVSGQVASLLYVANFGGNNVAAFLQTDKGDVSPQFVLSQAANGGPLNQPTGIVLGSLGHAYVTDQGDNTVQIYAIGSTGNFSGLNSLSCGGLAAPFGSALDASGRLYVSNDSSVGGDSVSIFSPGSSGCISGNPVLAGPLTMLRGPLGMTVDASAHLYVGNQNPPAAITVYGFVPQHGGQHDVAPVRTIGGPNANLGNVTALALDGKGHLFVASYYQLIVMNGFISEFAECANGDVLPIRTINGPDTGLDVPFGLAIGTDGEIYVSNRYGPGFSAGSIEVFAANASGDAKPIRVISGTNTGLNQPLGIALYNKT